jgi:hypothetical protein
LIDPVEPRFKNQVAVAIRESRDHHYAFQCGNGHAESAKLTVVAPG